VTELIRAQAVASGDFEVLKPLIVFGTRPEAVKLAPLVMELRRRPDALPILCATGQHREMLDQVLRLFELHPDHDLDLMRTDQQPADVAAAVLTGVGRVIDAEKPSIVVVQGDTTTAMAASLAAFFHRTPVAHVEAGLRTGIKSSPFPEELMRRIVGRIAELHFAPTARAAENLRAERADAEGMIFLTGNTVVDAVKWIAANRRPTGDLLTRRASRLVLLTAHRRENFGEPIRNVCRAVRALVARNADIEVAYPLHPNPNIQRPVRELLGGYERIHLLPPLDYEDLIGLMQESYLILTDSGGLQEEAPVFGKPVLVLRRDTERPEAIDAGSAILVGTDERRILLESERLLGDPAAYQRMAHAHSPFGDGFAAMRIADILLAFGRGDLEAVAQSRWTELGELVPYAREAIVA
jgi:UDP-N-acetylglucosamine 2-epimerase